MRGFRYTVIGFFCFLFTAGFNMSLGIIVYTQIEDKSDLFVGFLIFAIITLSALTCSIIDLIRRKTTVEKPLNEILYATKQMSRGNFNIHLYPYHSYKYYDEFDVIKDDLINMAKELSHSEVLKNDFVANLSHEIKTPLALIQGYVTTLKDESLTKQEREKYLDNLQDATKRLSNLITNILKLNKLENQKLIPELNKINLSELLANQILQYEDLIEKKNINLVCDIEDDLYINSEESYLELIFNNLMSNAIKFTNDNGEIKVSLAKINQDYIIKFIDNGCGMDENTGKHIFEKFYQGDTSHSKEGNGLGLSLVKKVIDILGGSISVESEINQGTIFTIIIKEVN